MEGVCVLQGTFETLSLPEVLGLLASARKSGALWLEIGSMPSVVHVEDGHCRAVETTDRQGPVDHGSELLDRLVEVCFNVVRVESGSFRFAAEEPAPWRCPEPVELSDALVEVERLVKQWREVVRVIPSLDCRPRLLDALVVDEVVFDRERWSLLVALDGRRTVRNVVEHAGLPALDVCHTLLELVEAGAVGILEPDAVRAEPVAEPVASPVAAAPPVAPGEPVPPAPPETVPAPVERAPEPVPEPAPAPPPPVERAPEPVPEPDAAPAPAPVVERPAFQPPPRPEPAPAARVEPEPTASEPHASDPVSESVGASAGADRGAFLRLFSGLRET
jgi:hypothetical protein